MNLLKLKVFIFLNLFITTIITASTSTTTHEESEINHDVNITNWKMPISPEEKKNVLEMIKHLVKVEEKFREKCRFWVWWRIPGTTADEIAEYYIKKYTNGGEYCRMQQDLAKNANFQEYYSNEPGKYAYKVNSEISYDTDDWEMPKMNECSRKSWNLSKDKLALETILMTSYLIEHENKEIDKRKILYRKHSFYADWEKDYQESKIIQINRFLSTSREKFHLHFKSRRMFITINIPPGTPCGMDVDKFSDYDEREVLIPPGTSFLITKVEKKRGFLYFGEIAEIEMTCLGPPVYYFLFISKIANKNT